MRYNFYDVFSDADKVDDMMAEMEEEKVKSFTRYFFYFHFSVLLNSYVYEHR